MGNKLPPMLAPAVLLIVVFLSLGTFAYKFVRGEKRPAGTEHLTPVERQPTPTKPLTSPAQKSVAELVAETKTDLSDRLAIPQSQISVQSVDAKSWSDASLGCPEPDMFYAQVITPGYRIKLEAGSQTYDYRASQQQVKLCEQSQESAASIQNEIN